jgi:hypothetical protein
MSNVDNQRFFDTLEEDDPEMTEIYNSGTASSAPEELIVWRTVKEVADDEGEEEEDIQEEVSKTRHLNYYKHL